MALQKKNKKVVGPWAFCDDWWHHEIDLNLIEVWTEEDSEHIKELEMCCMESTIPAQVYCVRYTKRTTVIIGIIKIQNQWVDTI